MSLGPYDAEVEYRPDGAIVLRSTEPLGDYPQRFTDWLQQWARERPDATFLQERDTEGNWRTLSYASALRQVRRLAQALLQRGLDAQRPVMILSGNSIEHALLSLAAMHVGIASVAVSPAYSLRSQDFERLRHAVRLLTPGLVFVSDAARFERAVEAVVPPEVEVACLRGTLARRSCTAFDALLDTEPTTQVDQAHERVGPDTIAKFLFTSGSTQLPKAVVNTHRMLCSNQLMYIRTYPYLREEPPVLVDWLPWHHTAGGNANLGLVLCNGGTMVIDDGKPTPEGMAATLRNLREVAPTACYTVPQGLEALVQAMKTDTVLRDRFFSRLRLIFPAGSALPPALKQALEEQAVASCGMRIPMTMGLGMTETGPFAVSAHLPDWQPGLIGLPAPGVEVKLAPCEGKLEVRYRGPNITPGYWRQPELTAQAFDDEGFFRSGDAASFVDPDRPALGLRFDGRIAEDFKLTSGTWVNVGALRARVVAAGAPHVRDAVIAGHDRECVGMLLVLHESAAALSDRLPEGASLAQIAHDPQVRAWAQALLDRVAAEGTGSSSRIVRAVVLDQPPSIERGEATDKGSINQRAVLAARAEWVEALFAPEPAPPVLVAG
ncbi:feruloyl-CoA synthase [Ramlibacter sp. AW1]|uniref:Feruloyl-CoA synthase n=1 Tax=Ramlibacter aurantiacus TaxID=2801330 RepID=A0A937D7M7_9BURK|nr:feruloyl-CoA synthase [Ramlibacter aurantiacus]